MRICQTCKHKPPSKKWPCVDCDMRVHDRWEQGKTLQTNYDRIVRKSPEELAWWLAELTATRCNGKQETRRMKILKWLKEEAKE